MILDIDTDEIDAIFAGLGQDNGPGAAVGIALEGKPVYRKGFGLAKLRTAEPITPQTQMRIGSVTKQFTCLAYLLMCEEGKAGIDDRLGRYLPELHPVTHAVTLRQLMGNISGLRDVCDLRLQLCGNEGLRSSSDELVSLYREIDDANAAPGTTYIYNNGGFLLLSAVIERIDGRPLEEVLQKRVFDPVGMPNTLLRRWDENFEPNSAIPYAGNAVEGFEPGRYSLDWAGAGAVVSTVDDMLRWLAHMDAPRIGSEATWKQMRTAQPLVNDVTTRYGLGLSLTRYRGLEAIHHSGGWMGANAYAIKIPAIALDIVVMVNRHDVVSVTLANRVIDACISGLEPIVAAASGTLTGVFKSPASGRIVRLFSENGLQMGCIDGMDLPLAAASERALRSMGAFSALDLEIVPLSDASRPTAIALKEFGNREELALALPARSGLDWISGRYRNDSTGTEIVIEARPEELLLKAKGRFGLLEYRLRCLAEDVWLAQPQSCLSNAVLSFEGDGSGFWYSTYATRSLPFRRCT